MKRTATTALIAVGQLALVGVAVAPQLSARALGDTTELGGRLSKRGLLVLGIRIQSVADDLRLARCSLLRQPCHLRAQSGGYLDRHRLQARHGGITLFSNG